MVIAIQPGGTFFQLRFCVLVTEERYVGRSTFAVLIVSPIIYWIARPIFRVGIVVPTRCSTDGHGSRALARAELGTACRLRCGSLGTLIGADPLT
jgi:uncharacterized membrane protein